MDVFQLILAVLAIVATMGGGVVYIAKKYSDGKYIELESRLKTAALKSESELEEIRAKSAQAQTAADSIKALTAAIVVQVEERRESTVAMNENAATTKENTEALKTMSTSIDGMSKDRGDGMALLTTAVTGLTTTVTEISSLLVKAVSENTDILKTVATGQDDMEKVFEVFALVVNRLKYDNKRFAEYILRPSDASKQGIEDIATSIPEPEPETSVAAVTL